eukprot:scaffold248326_cov55-Attheya_sp.AAC.2
MARGLSACLSLSLLERTSRTVDARVRFGKTRSRAFQSFNRWLNQTSTSKDTARMARGLNDRRNSKSEGTAGKKRSRAFQNCNGWLNLIAAAKVTGSSVGRDIY